MALDVVESGVEVSKMATISNRAVSIFKDACGVHDFSDEEQARVEVLAEQLNQILNSSKERLKQKGAHK